jgi:hypothetical protein
LLINDELYAIVDDSPSAHLALAVRRMENPCPLLLRYVSGAQLLLPRTRVPVGECSTLLNKIDMEPSLQIAPTSIKL